MRAMSPSPLMVGLLMLRVMLLRVRLRTALRRYAVGDIVFASVLSLKKVVVNI